LQGIVELTGGESGYIRTLHHFLIVLLVVEVLFISLQRERSMVGKFSVGLLSFLLVVFFLVFSLGFMATTSFDAAMDVMGKILVVGIVVWVIRIQ
jgi:hypothetical protein